MQRWLRHHRPRNRIHAPHGAQPLQKNAFQPHEPLRRVCDGHQRTLRLHSALTPQVRQCHMLSGHGVRRNAEQSAHRARAQKHAR